MFPCHATGDFTQRVQGGVVDRVQGGVGSRGRSIAIRSCGHGPEKKIQSAARYCYTCLFLAARSRRGLINLGYCRCCSRHCCSVVQCWCRHQSHTDQGGLLLPVATGEKKKSALCCYMWSKFVNSTTVRSNIYPSSFIYSLFYLSSDIFFI